MFKGIKSYVQVEDSKKQKKPLEPGSFSILRARELLALYKPQMPITELPEILNLDEMQYETHCTTLIERFAEFVQSLPETQNSYFSKPGGILTHGLHRALLATKLSRAYFLPEETEANESLTQRQMLWAYAVFSAGLLYNVGKVIVDFSVTILDRFGAPPKKWNAWEGSMVGQGTDYKYEFNNLNQDEFRKRVTLTIAKEIMPQQSFLWIASDADVLAAWLAMLEEDERRSGLLGVLILRADAELIQRNLLEQKIPHKIETKVGSIVGEGFSPFAKTQKTGSSFALSDINIANDFLTWVREAQEKGTIKTNDAKSGPVHVNEGALITKQVFENFLAERPQYKDVNTVVNALAKMELHEVGLNNQIFHDYAILNKNETVQGIVIKNSNIVFPYAVTPERQQEFVKVLPLAAAIDAKAAAAAGISLEVGKSVQEVLDVSIKPPSTPTPGR